MTIKEVSERFGVSTDTLRYYERIVNNPVSMSPLSGDRKPQIRF